MCIDNNMITRSSHLCIETNDMLTRVSHACISKAMTCSPGRPICVLTRKTAGRYQVVSCVY